MAVPDGDDADIEAELERDLQTLSGLDDIQLELRPEETPVAPARANARPLSPSTCCVVGWSLPCR